MFCVCDLSHENGCECDSQPKQLHSSCPCVSSLSVYVMKAKNTAIYTESVCLRSHSVYCNKVLLLLCLWHINKQNRLTDASMTTLIIKMCEMKAFIHIHWSLPEQALIRPTEHIFQACCKHTKARVIQTSVTLHNTDTTSFCLKETMLQM